jgi:membrane fusion protein (multidrug efflux system)
MKALSVVAPVTEQPVGDVLDLVGEMIAKDSADLVSEVDARVEEIGSFNEGFAVPKGALLFRFDDTRLQALLARARADHALAAATFKRSKELRESNTIPQQDLDEAEAALRSAEAALALAAEDVSDARVEAPFEGRITRRLVSVGQFVARGTRLASLIRMEVLELVFHVPERFTPWLDIAQVVEFRHAGGASDLMINYLAPRVDPDTRTLEVKAVIDNRDGKLRPGMFGRVRLTVNVNPKACTIPAPALVLSATGSRVVVMNAEGLAEFRPVTPGRRVDGMVEIVEGLKAGERVVVEGHQKIGPGMGIEISPKSSVYGINPEAPAAP